MTELTPSHLERSQPLITPRCENPVIFANPASRRPNRPRASRNIDARNHLRTLRLQVAAACMKTTCENANVGTWNGHLSISKPHRGTHLRCLLRTGTGYEKYHYARCMEKRNYDLANEHLCLHLRRAALRESSVACVDGLGRSVSHRGACTFLAPTAWLPQITYGTMKMGLSGLCASHGRNTTAAGRMWLLTMPPKQMTLRLAWPGCSHCG